MKIHKRFFFLAVLCFLSLDSFAQLRDISLNAGIHAPMYKGVESDVAMTLTYGHFYWNGLGFRTGLRWSPSVANVDNAFGVPVALAYRTRAQKPEDRFRSGMAGAAESLGHSMVYGNSGRAVDVFGAFLMNLFSDMEFFAGLTPGYIAGSSSGVRKSSWGNAGQYKKETWTENRTAFSLTADAGICLNYSIWHFDVKLMPAFHYNMLNSYVQHVATSEAGMGTKETDVMPLKWFFSLSGGLAFKF